MTEVVPPRPVVLAILDGWGDREQCEMNAVCLAATPNLDRFDRGPRAQIDASEGEVGLPSGQMGNSEVGHMNLGAGRVVPQDLPRIDEALGAGALTGGAAFQDFVAALKRSGGTAHVLGLLSPGGVHCHQDHMAALANALLDAGVPVQVHAFLDGRDTPPRSALDYLARFDSATKAPIATVSGRYYAMDRDRRWDRTAEAYRTLVTGRAAPQGRTAAQPSQAVEQAYQAGKGDEFVAPTSIADYAGMADGDGLLMANFRADRVRQLLRALLDPGFADFPRERTVEFAATLGMTSYAEDLDRLMPALLPPLELHDTLGEVVSRAGLTQLRIAETEKYAHVTFFFNGGRETEFDGEERILVPSPQVATYDLQPEMSAPEVTDRLCEAVASGRFDLIVVNYANGDMVGHTGYLEAAKRAVETVDTCLGRLAASVEAAGGCLLITADHGNAEQMEDPATGQPHTAHTMNPVPLVLVNAPAWVSGLTNGRLADIAPTVLELMNLPAPSEMTGRSLIRSDARARNAPATGAAAE